MEARAMKRPVHSATALAALAICATLAGCAAPRQPLYAWNDYQPQVYQYLKDDGSTGAEDQLLKLEEARLKVQAERSEEHTSELQSPCNLVCRLLLEKKKQLNRKQLPTDREPREKKNVISLSLRTTAVGLHGYGGAI